MSSRVLSSGCLLGIAVTGVVVLSSEAARADDVSACVEAYDAAQVLRRAGTLVAAREKLLVCGRATCPEVVQSSCTTWLDEVDRSMPTIVLHARGPNGDIVDVRVLVDGQVVRESLDGRAVPIDPGVHTFRFQVSDDRVVETRVVVQEGVKNRLISVDFDEPAPAKPAQPSERPVEQRGEPSPRAAEAVVDTGDARADDPTLAYVLGGVGVVGLGAFAAFGVSFDRQYEDLQACSPGCDASDVDRASSTRTLAVVSGGIGVVALGAAAILWLGTDGRGEAPVAPASGVSVQVTPGAAMGAWTTRF